ncbi:IclR family transcriptional regulator [Jannaschia sp. 2305UL9-9]|uniref:IclR family transcriptional regulator n=1 Tax=Jannaschia sp. 2305UL9-9 TaxID=3121638 RepID=UPI00352927DA
MNSEPGQDRYTVPGLLRGLRVLEAFSPDRPEMSLAQIAAALGTTRSAAFRTVYTLQAAGCLLHNERRHTYMLGPAVLRLTRGYLPTREAVELALPELERLSEATGWSGHLGVLEETSVLYLLRVSGQGTRNSIVHVGSRLPARTTSLGRVLLAGLGERALAALFRRVDEGMPAAQMAALLERARDDAARGIVVHVGDFEAGIAAVAAPLRDLTGGVVAAISLTAPAQTRGQEAVPAEVRAALDASARRLSRMLGASGADLD